MGLTLRGNQRDYYYEGIREVFPRRNLVGTYRRTYGDRYECSSPKGKELWNLFKMECERYGILYKMEDIIEAYRRNYEEEATISTFANSINEEYEPLKGQVYSIMYYFMNSYCNYNGEEVQAGTINVPYFKGDGDVRLYTPEKDSKVYKTFSEYGIEEDMLGDIFFLLKDSKASPKFKGE